MENEPMKAGWVGIAASRVGQSDTDPLPKLLPLNIEPQHLKLLANLAIKDQQRLKASKGYKRCFNLSSQCSIGSLQTHQCTASDALWCLWVGVRQGEITLLQPDRQAGRRHQIIWRLFFCSGGGRYSLCGLWLCHNLWCQYFLQDILNTTGKSEESNGMGLDWDISLDPFWWMLLLWFWKGLFC